MRRSILPPALAALALGACRDGSGPDRPIALPLSLRVVPARASIVSGDTVTLRLTARNIGDRTVTVDAAYGCLMSLRLQGPTGQWEETVVLRAVGACPPPRTSFTLAPGDSVVETVTWEAGVIVGGDVFARADAGTWTLHPVVITGSGKLPGTLDVPATVTVVSP